MFQLTRPRGARLYMLIPFFIFTVSTHAPARGATVIMGIYVAKPNFSLYIANLQSLSLFHGAFCTDTQEKSCNHRSAKLIKRTCRLGVRTLVLYIFKAL